VTFTATNALSGSATTAITVTNVDRAPVVTAPATATGAEGALLTVNVTAADPDGDAIASLTASGTAITAGATFAANASNTAGTLSWTPNFTQAGSYSATFTAANALSGSATTAITINNTDRAPVVTAPATASGASNTLLTFTVSAADPDGDAIASLTGAPLPSGATFTANAANTSGTFSWTPTNAQTGTFNVTFTASNALSGSATTAITVTNGDRAPVVTAPATASGAENTLITFTVSAVDPDGEAIATLTAAPLPSGATFTSNAAHTSGTFNWTPSFSQSGSYNVTFTATNALSGSATTAITVTNVDRAPVVTAPATASGNEGTLISFTVSASDPDGDAIASLTGAPLPSGATFTANAANTSGTFNWTPSFTQAGSYNVTFTAANALTGSASTSITVNNVDRAPVVTAPPTASGAEGTTITFNVSAADPDGDAIASLTAAPLPGTATFTANAANTAGTFSWTTTLSDAGTYNVTFTATNALSGSATTAVTVTNANQNPVVTAPATASGDEGTLITFGVSATDPDGDHVTLTALGTPSGATFTDNGDNTGTFSWTPSFTQAGSYSVTFRGNDGNGGIANATTSITVNNVDRAPTANAGGPYTGITGLDVSFNGSASSDPDGDVLAYAWDFGDGGSSTAQSPAHAYAMAGVYNVTLTVTANSLSDADATTATISDTFSATAFTTGGNKTTSLAAGKPYTCIQVQPDGGTFDATNVDLASLRMVYPSGSANSILADASKSALDGDKNTDGIQEVTACFRKTDMRTLFTGLPSGPNTVTIDITGSLIGGGQFKATTQIIVKSNGTFLAASISPNPLNPQAKLTFMTTKPGAVRVQMFDPQGRLVKTITDGTTVQAGYHDFTIDGRSATGSKLASGVYFVKVWSQFDGTEVKSVTILK
jgi:membrane-bound inhibitor of C-type lysozyme